MRRKILALAAMLALAGCDGDRGGTGTDGWQLTGSWSTSATAGQYTDIELQLSQGGGGVVTGTWTAFVTGGGGAGGFQQSGTVTGVHEADHDVTLTLEEPGIGFSGEMVSATRMEGDLVLGPGSRYTATFDK